jgi:uncharacterized coiled-coil DUF342 family protein
MQSTESSGDLQQTMQSVLSEIRQLRHDVETYRHEVTDYKQEVLGYKQEVLGYKQEVLGYKQEVGTFNDKFENYQKATQWVVQLAFSLIAAATVTVVVSSVFNK